MPLVGFAQAPADSRSACVAVLSAANGSLLTVEECRPLGAPLVFVCSQSGLQWWKQGARAPELLENIPAEEINGFFQAHMKDFSPDVVYRAKTWGRFQSGYQLSFVDLGLMPVVEEEVGHSLGTLIERNVSDLMNRLGWRKITEEQGQWLLHTIFWLVSGKILRDKKVAGFEDLNLSDVEEVFDRLATHYGTDPLDAGPREMVEALRESAHAVDQFSSLVLTTTESLAYVYENTLISKKARASLGTHSTPSFLVDYVVGNIAEWVKEIQVEERSVFEPACGHAGFMVSAMRLLTELLPPERKVPSRRRLYLRSRLHGNDVDAFALELARLDLTLTDIPNPDGWDLEARDMFLGNRLAEQAKRSTILLANPPFDNFTAEERDSYRAQSSPVRFVNKSAEMLWRTVPNLPAGAVFGVVMPQTFLHSKNATELRRFLLAECELKEICLFPDKVFSFSDAESTILIGRRKRVSGRNNVMYRRVREREVQTFRSRYLASTTRSVSQSRFSAGKSFSMRLPDLEEVWEALAENPKVADIAVLAQGLIYHGKQLSSGTPTYSEQHFEGSQQGFVLFNHGLQLHETPKIYWMNLDSSAIRRPVGGTKVGTPQVLLNYAPASRGPWRLKALIDRHGHPVTSNFIPVRPTSTTYSLETTWALLNSPVANAYAFSTLGRRHNIVGQIRKMPVPKVRTFGGLHRAASAYLEAARSGQPPAALQRLLLRVDCEVLGLYSLPLQLEQMLLAVFRDWERVGVPFRQTRYVPKEIEGSVRLCDFVQFEEDWPATNRERGILIDKNVSGTISTEEQQRLSALQAYADYHINQVAPRPTHVLDELEKRLFPGLSNKDGPV